MTMTLCLPSQRATQHINVRLRHRVRSNEHGLHTYDAGSSETIQHMGHVCTIPDTITMASMPSNINFRLVNNTL